MTTAVTIGFTPLSVADVSVGFLDQTKLVRRKSTQIDANTRSTEYVYAYGDPTQETTVTVRSGFIPKSGVVTTSILLRTQQVVTVDGLVTEQAPLEFSINWNTPGASEDTTVLRSMLCAIFSLAFNGVTSKVPNLGIIDKLNRGLTEDIFG